NPYVFLLRVVIASPVAVTLYSIEGYRQNRRNTLRFRARGSKSQEITSRCNLLIDRYLKYLFNNALHLGTALAELSCKMKFRMKVNRISTKKLASLLKKLINRKHH